MSQSPSALKDRIRVSQACDNCRDKKAKCDGIRPVCGRCQVKSLECHYGTTKRIKNQQVMKELATKVAQYESLLKRNIPAQQRILEQSANASVTPNTASSPRLSDIASGNITGQSNDPSTGRIITGSSSSVSQLPSETVSPSIATVPSHGPDAWPRSTIDHISIPPRPLLEYAIKSFLEGASLTFPFFDDDEISSLLGEVYSRTIETSSKVALVQLCVTAAVGCQYFPQRHDAASAMAFLSVGKLKMEECIEDAPLPAMRILALLAMYYTFEKRTAALMYVDMGLRMARMNRHKTMIFETPQTAWQRVYGSLIFLDCWLCATTGHMPSLQNRELHSSMVMNAQVNGPIVATVQFEMIKIAILSTSILQDVYHTRYVSSMTITSYKNQLQQWLWALPEFMRLDSLLATNEDAHHLRPIFMIHLLYMITFILVYRRILVELSDLDRRRTNTDTFNQTQGFLEHCLWTGRQVAKILEIALSQGQILPKCWMYIYATFSTCNVLLYFVASRLLHDDTSEELRQDIAAAKQCIDVLEYCASVDESARQFLISVSSIYEKISEIHAALVSMVGIKDEELIGEKKESLRRIVTLTAALLIHPFDGGYRRETQDLPDSFLQPTTGTTESPYKGRARSDTEMLSPGLASVAQQSMSNVFLNDFLNSDTGLESRGKRRESEQGPDTLSSLFPKGVFFGS